MVKVSKFDVLDYLDSEEMIEEYLKAVQEEGDSDLLRSARVTAEKARAALLAKKSKSESKSLID